MSRPADEPGRALPCPRCRRPAAPAHMPFCSAACRDRDLLDWLEERHVLPGPAIEAEGGESSER